MSAPITIDEAIRRMESLRPGVAVSDKKELVGRGLTRMEALQDALRKLQAWHQEILAQPPAVDPDGQLLLWSTR